MITGNFVLMLSAFLLVAGLICLVSLLLGGRDAERVDLRISEAGGAATRAAATAADRSSRSALPRVGAVIMPDDESKLARLKSRLQQAGLYRRHSTAVYLGVKFVLMVSPLLVGLGLCALGMLSLAEGILLGTITGLVGNVAPTLWLSHLKGGRQKSIRRALPDALDVIVVCMEGGLSLPASLARVATELRTAHPLLADEMAIARREIQLGRSTGEALKQLAERFDVEELRSLASVVVQAERFGASIVRALRVHADSLRIKRYQYAEAQAQKAPVKLIFPTVLCIFPALYIVLMGPAGIRLLELLDSF